jgi:hypothetical protein
MAPPLGLPQPPILVAWERWAVLGRLSLVLDDVNAIASADEGKQNEVSWSLERRWEALLADADQSPIDLYRELGTGQQAVTDH